MSEQDTDAGESTEEAPESARKAAARRRRASRAAGPAAGTVVEATGVRVEKSATVPAAVKVRLPRVGPPPRRRPNARLVALVGLSVAAVLVAVLGGVVALLITQQRAADAAQARKQEFIDTGTQTVVNMFSYNQNNIDDSVNRFVNGTSGPLRDMMSQPGNVDNLKAIFRDTHASSETVVSGAALEKVDEIAKNASVLVSVRVTVSDVDGVNKPSQAYRLRVIVHEDDNGHMTGYDLKYPDGGN
ncbi:mammalian cell entry protein [Mycolicibacterium sp. P9-64]|uniref:mammalian cell entry protein n=1 Tax=Mycolicibacterium sp. P9-64 TaxID=2024612 RepID=UPI0011EFA671|nr:mammalian cell entry protein [Mycolicibacterium sp. P9-64]KAA0082373.1 mammalian cell entry protein [Mycolicibacterium sp. P9-64]